MKTETKTVGHILKLCGQHPHYLPMVQQPPIGSLLCTRKNHELVESALAGMSNNIFVSRYQVELPGKEEIAAFLHRAVEELEAMPQKSALAGRRRGSRKLKGAG